MNTSLRYSFSFEPISENNGSVSYFDPKSQREIEAGFTIKDQALWCRARTDYSSEIADLLDLAVAIYASDRLASQDLYKSPCEIHVCLPIRNLTLMNSSELKEKLSELLDWATGSKWTFEFKPSNVLGRTAEEQFVIPLSLTGNIEVALWSGGLDSLAGLYTRMDADRHKNFILFGTGANSNIHNQQLQVFDKLKCQCARQIQLYRIPLVFNKSNSSKKNKISRARGVVFMLLGSACSYLMGQSQLFVYENGIGAINLPYRSSGVGLDHSRSTNPLTLLKVSNIVSYMLNLDFKITNPFLFWTKTQMCKTLAQKKRDSLASITMSCDSPHRKKVNQCGYCSSCLLRRQSLLAAGMNDQTRYVLLHSNQPPRQDPSIPLRHMLRQLETFKTLLSFSKDREHVWSAFAYQFPVLDDIVDQIADREGKLVSEMRESIIQLYESYVTEWDTVSHQISTSLLQRT